MLRYFLFNAKRPYGLWSLYFAVQLERRNMKPTRPRLAANFLANLANDVNVSDYVSVLLL